MFAATFRGRAGPPKYIEKKMTTSETNRLRSTVVWGAVNNMMFAVVGGALTFIQFLVVLRLVGPEQIGLYAMASVFANTVESISEFGVGDRLIQRDADRFQDSYNVAATAHFLFALALAILILISAPLMAGFYHQPALRPLLMVMSYAAFSGFCRLPLSLLLREFKYFQQRLLMFIGKVAGFIVTVGLGYAGYGVWALVLGAIATLAVTSVPAWILATVRPRWKIEYQEMRALLNFTGPLWIGRVTMILVQQGTVLALSLFLSTREVGEFKAAEQIVFFLVSIDVILGQTIFPALCKVKDSSERIGIGFTKASRASMLWIAGFGMGMCVFADAIVRFVLTAKWDGAEMFVQAQGAALIIGGVAYSWGFLFEAKGQTRPILYVISLLGAAFVLLFVPLTYTFGKPGAALGVVAVCAAGLLAKQYFITRLGMGISLFDIVKRSLGAALAASLAILLARRLLNPPLSVPAVLLQVTAYGLVYVCVLGWTERALLGEVLHVLKQRKADRTFASVAGGYSR